MSSLTLRFAAVAILIVQVGWPATAQEAATQTCGLHVSEARFRLDHLREEERLAPIKLVADQAIFELFEPLWAARSTERLRYLAAKHARDRSRLYVDRATIRVNRKAAELDVLTRECFSSNAGPGEALRRFEVLGCELVRKEKDISVLDLAYREEVLKSTKELRRLELATAQEMIQARFSLDLAAAQLRSRTERQKECAKADPPN